jgi:hypothetical protein
MLEIFSFVSLSCFEMHTGKVILMLRWPDRRSATTIGVARVWEV